MRYLGLLLLLAGCGGGGDGDGGTDFTPLTDPALEPAARCVALGANVLARVVERTQQFLAFVNGAPLPPGVTETSMTEYVMELDLEGDAIADVTLTFTIVSGDEQLGDGWQPGEQIRVDLDFVGAASGGGTIDVSLVDADPDVVIVRGPVMLADGASCTFDAPDFVVTWEVGDVSTAFPNFFLSGTDDGAVFSGQLFLDEDSGFLIVSGTLDGEARTFAIDPDTFDVFDEGGE